MEKKNNRYEKPVLDDLDIVGHGEDCPAGPSATTSCLSGTSAVGGTCTTGSIAAGACSDGGIPSGS